MDLSIILTTILSTFAIEPTDLCAEVHTDPAGVPYTDLLGQTLSVYCEWTGPHAPVWDDDVCCSIDDDGAACTVTDTNGRCPRGLDQMYCEFGEVVLADFVCYQPFPDACDNGWCFDGPPLPQAELAWEFIVCCSPGGACQYVHDDDNALECQGEILYCEWGILHDGGVVECLG